MLSLYSNHIVNLHVHIFSDILEYSASEIHFVNYCNKFTPHQIISVYLYNIKPIEWQHSPLDE